MVSLTSFISFKAFAATSIVLAVATTSSAQMRGGYVMNPRMPGSAALGNQINRSPFAFTYSRPDRQMQYPGMYGNSYGYSGPYGSRSNYSSSPYSSSPNYGYGQNGYSGSYGSMSPSYASPNYNSGQYSSYGSGGSSYSTTANRGSYWSPSYEANPLQAAANDTTSGATLNQVLARIEQARLMAAGDAIALDAAVVKSINVSPTGESKDSNEFFKAGSFKWPEIFASEAVVPARKTIETTIAAPAEVREGGQPGPATINDARRAAAGLREQLFAMRGQASFSSYAAALEFLAKLDSILDTLSRPDAKNYLDGTYVAKGDTAAELTDYMTAKGLKFAKASAGGEGSYAVLYQKLLEYEKTLKFPLPPAAKSGPVGKNRMDTWIDSRKN